MRFLIYILFILTCYSGFSQSEDLAKNYFEQGEYEKALKTYQKLYENNNRNRNYFEGFISSLQELERYKQAEILLLEKVKNPSNSPHHLVELGFNFQLQEREQEAQKYYQKALQEIEIRPNYAYMIAKTFQKYTLLEEAVAAYEAGMKQNKNVDYHIQLAKLYGEMGQMEKMFSNYIALLEDKPQYFHIVKRYFDLFLTDDPENEINVIFRNLLLKKLQSSPNIQYNEMLSWLFTQQKEFKKAFLQEKAIYRRSNGNLNNIINLAIIAKDEKNYETASEILNFVIAETPNEHIALKAHQELLEIKIANSEGNYDKIEKEFQDLFNQYGRGSKTYELQIAYANFLAFQKDEKNAAAQMLKNLKDSLQNDYQEAKTKMALADILVMDNEFNQALIYYAQIQHLERNAQISQEARFKVAKTSYYKGDFAWAKNQLDVLKTSTSQLIANDAMELSLLISDNSLEDSTQSALKKFAQADLLIFQNKKTEAIKILEDILEAHSGEKIIDDALLRLGNLFHQQEKYKKAVAAYQQIIEDFKTGILADDAYFALAELYEKQLNQPEKAKENYEQIIFNHADSIYFVDARKSFRKLRGDAIE